MTAEEILATHANLPALPVVTAPDMLRAQGYSPSKDDRAAIKARADWFEALDMPREVGILVVDIYTGSPIGHLIFKG